LSETLIFAGLKSNLCLCFFFSCFSVIWPMPH
jgi:hypothetical protein